MQAEVHLIHQSDFYQIRDFRCACVECSTSKLEQCERFSICFVRKGYYEQHVFRQQQEMHVGRVLVTKPGIEYVIRHIDNQPDLCTSINFSDAFYLHLQEYLSGELSWFFRNPDLQSLLLTSPPEAEYLHQQILAAVSGGVKLEVDDLVVRLVDAVMRIMGNSPVPAALPENLKRHHLQTAEKAKDYLIRNFHQEVSLQQLADHCCVSLFHFSRIFRSVLKTTPHQYLLALRLHHARLLMDSTDARVTEVAFQSGFQSLEHFTTSYRKHFGTTPSASRMGKGQGDGQYSRGVKRG
ncbi:MAG: helix-turn-helix transcriptional regulator [Cyclobacteriaceae bacterium]|nr:helix-turn-helix transcriptional regulator [Cyclobacteriaceae bacterium]